jgi:hypothetical protein
MMISTQSELDRQKEPEQTNVIWGVWEVKIEWWDLQGGPDLPSWGRARGGLIRTPRFHDGFRLNLVEEREARKRPGARAAHHTETGMMVYGELGGALERPMDGNRYSQARLPARLRG